MITSTVRALSPLCLFHKNHSKWIGATSHSLSPHLDQNPNAVRTKLKLPATQRAKGYKTLTLFMRECQSP